MFLNLSVSYPSLKSMAIEILFLIPKAKNLIDSGTYIAPLRDTGMSLCLSLDAVGMPFKFDLC